MELIYNLNRIIPIFRTGLLWAVLIISGTSPLLAQSITNYSTTSATGTFTGLTTPTNPSLTSGNADDGYFNNIPIGFDFWYMGTRHTTISASTNGWITLGANITNDVLNNNLTSGGSPRPVIAPLWDDLNIQTASNLSYKTTGSSGSRIFTIQYLNVKWDYASSEAEIEFQVKLYEGTGRVEFIYNRKGTATLSSPSASIGITATNTGSGNFLSLTAASSPSVSSINETTTINSKPATGQIFRFTPVVPAAATSLTFSNVQTTGMTLNWTDNSSNETGFAIYRSTDNVTFTYVSAVEANSTSGSVSALTEGTTYYWRIYAVSEGGLSTALTGTQATTCTSPNISLIPTSGLIAHYKLNENANDATGNNNGTFQGGTPTLTTDRFGISNKAYAFNGSSHYVSTSNSYSNPSIFSLSLWIKTNTTSGGRLIGFGTAQTGSSGSRDRMLWMDNKGFLRFGVNPGGTSYVITSAQTYNDGNWHHIVVTCSNVAGRGINMYVDGSLVSTNTSGLGGENYTGYWRINYDAIGWSNSPSSNYFNGSMDDILIYHSELTSTQVSTLYNKQDGAGNYTAVCEGGTLNLTAPTISGVTYSWTGPNGFSSSSQNPSISNMSSSKEGTYTLTVTNTSGCTTPSTAYVIGKINKALGPAISQIPTSGLLSLYKLDGNGNDEQSNNHGILQGSPTLITDRFGNTNSAYTFNGTSNYISTSVSYANPSNFTISVWFKTSTTEGGDLASFGTQATGYSAQHDRVLYMNNTGKIYFGIWPGTVETVNSTYTYNDNKWHMATASLSSTNGMKLYIDGALVASNASITSAENTTGYWKFGYDDLWGWTSPPTGTYFNGSIDDILIYNRELSASDVSILYSSAGGAGSNSTVCDNGTLNLTATTVGSTTYAWTGPNSFSSSSQNPSLSNMSTVKEGTYTLTATSGGCISKAYALAKINYDLGPVISQIPTSGFQSRFKLDGNANDHLNRNHGKLQNLPTLTTDRFANDNSAYTFNGTNQYIYTSANYINPTNVTLSLWFKTTTTQGGKLIGFGTVQSGLSGSYDRHIYMDDSGKIHFGVNPASGMSLISSTASYNDGNWHHVVATLGSGGGSKLYLDNELVASDPVPTGGQNYTGYWKIGYGNLNGWANTPTSRYFNGSIDDVMIYSGIALSAANVSILYRSADGAGSDAPVCGGSILTLSATTLGGATYSWTGPNSFSSASQNPTLTYGAAYAGTYTLQVTASGCRSTAYTSVASKTTGAGQWTGGWSNAWANPDNWCNVTQPNSSVDVIIPATAANMPTVSSSVSCQNLTIDASAGLTIASGGTLNIYGNITNNGTYTDNGTSVFTGSSAQSITGSATFNNVTLANANGLTLNNSATIKGILTLTSGTLASGENLSLNLNTGAIAGTGTGSISGNLMVKKSVSSSKYHYISSPLSGVTVSELNDDVPVGTNKLYSYNETNTSADNKQGWTSVSNLSAPLETAKGYALYFFYGVTLDLNGTYNHTTPPSNLTLTNTPSGDPDADGWHLIGNPYPSTIDWEASSGWTKTNLENAIYFWDPVNNRYASYINGSGTNGGSRHIPSMQSFWVKVNTSGINGMLGMNNGVRTTAANPALWKKQHQNEIRLTATSAMTKSDEMIVRMIENAEEIFDPQFDARKFFNDGTTPNIYSELFEVPYSINSLPEIKENYIIPLKLDVKSSGDYTITSDLSELDEESYGVFLEDREMNSLQDLHLAPAYTSFVEKNSLSDRFYLHIVYKSGIINPVYNPVPNSEMLIHSEGKHIYISSSGTMPSISHIIIYNVAGQEIYSERYSSNSFDTINILLENAIQGIYLVEIATKDKIHMQKVYITE